jgi:hypothetical protein
MQIWKYHVCNVLSIRRLGYNCTVYFNRRLTDNMYHVGGGPRMRKGCRAHIRRKVVVRDDAVMASTMSIPMKRMRRPSSLELFCRVNTIDCRPVECLPNIEQ